MNGCEPNEVLLKTLPVGAAFELTLTHTTGIRGVVVQHCSGSTIVDVGKREHWCYDAPVVPHPEALAEDWIKSNEEETMANGEKIRTPKAVKAQKVKKVKTYLVVRYEPTAKDGAKLLAKENDSQAAFMYRALVAAKEPLSISECYAACKGKLETQAAYERLGKNLNSTLFALRKAGYVKKQEKREEIQAQTAAA